MFHISKFVVLRVDLCQDEDIFNFNLLKTLHMLRKLNLYVSGLNSVHPGHPLSARCIIILWRQIIQRNHIAGISLELPFFES